MLRGVLILFHLLELSLYSALFMWFSDGTVLHGIITVLCAGLVLRASITVFTLLIAKVPLRPLSLTAAAAAAEFYAMVRLYSFDSLLTSPRHVVPSGFSDKTAVANTTHLPILFVHGFTCNSGFWRVFLKQGLRRWHNHMGTINLEPVFCSIDQYSARIEERVDDLLKTANSSQCLIVAHSMGGLAVRKYLHDTRLQQKIKGVITLGTPHTGTLFAHFSAAPNALQMRRLNQWLSDLEKAEAANELPPIEAVIGTHDNIVSPQECAALERATNTYFPGLTHLAMAYSQPLIDWTFTRLERMSRP